MKIKAAVIDNDLNVRPVPKLKLVLRSLLPKSQETALTTNFDGVVEVDTASGNYEIRTVQPIQFQGRQYSWTGGKNINDDIGALVIKGLPVQV